MVIEAEPGTPPARVGACAPPSSTVAIAVVFTGLGLALILQSSRWYATSAYRNLLTVVSAPVWGVVYLVVAAGLTACIAFRHSRALMVTAHAFAAALTLVWTVAFLVRALTSATTTVANPLNWGLQFVMVILSALALDRARLRR